MNLESPFDILGVREDADDDAIRAAYVAGVQRYPPDRDAEGFQRIRVAYELLKNKDERLKLKLFGRPADAAGHPSEWLSEGQPQRVYAGPGPWLHAIRRLARPKMEKKG